MTPKELAEKIAALDFSDYPIEHRLAFSAAVETLRTAVDPLRALLDVRKLAAASEYGEMNADPLVVFVPEPSNVVALPVRPRTCWTTLCHLDGRQWATSSHFGPGGAWSWIVDTVMHEHGCDEDSVHAVEDLDGLYDGDDLLTVDGLPLYRIRHLVK